MKVGEYIGPGLLGPTLAKILRNTCNFAQLNVLVEKAAPIKCFSLIKGLSNWFAFGKIDMEDNQFRGHVIDHQNDSDEKFLAKLTPMGGLGGI